METTVEIDAVGLSGDNLLSDLAVQVAEQSAFMRRAETLAASAAVDVGFLLIQAKDACQHGQWLPFLSKAGVGERYAQRLMQLARSGLTPDTVSDLGMKAALALVANRCLPAEGEALIVAVGDAGLGDDAAAFIWHSAEKPGQIELMSLHSLGHQWGHGIAFKEPVAAEAGKLIFDWVDRMLDQRHGEMRFEVVPDDDGGFAGLCRGIRDQIQESSRGAH